MFLRLIPISLILLVSVVHFGSSCGQKKERFSTFLDSVMDFISKAKSEYISCETECNINERALDCADLYRRGCNVSGLYTIEPNSRVTSVTRLDVYCDMVTDGGGWTVIQRRGDFQREDNYFDKDWESYKKGFGNLEKDFWLGNDNIFAITNQRLYSIRFEVKDKKQEERFAHYGTFWIDDEFNKYTLHISDYSGNAENAMARHDKLKFSTKDNDNDIYSGNCAKAYNSGWWFTDCYRVNLNGMYNNKTYGIKWRDWKDEPLDNQAEMKIRPSVFKVL